MNSFYNEIASAALQIVCALIGIFLTVVVVPWLNGSVIPWLKEKQLYSLVSKFVQAAEKLAETGAIDRESKKNYVVKLLRDKGYTITEEVEAFIESAVKELDMAVDSGLSEIFEVFEEEDPGDTPEDEEAAEEVVG